MGGHALGPALRLTSPQHAALERYCQSKLQGLFPMMRSPPYLRAKETHGDLDLICAWDGCEVGKFEKGEYGGRVRVHGPGGCGGNGAEGGVKLVDVDVEMGEAEEDVNQQSAAYGETLYTQRQRVEAKSITAPEMLERAAATMGGTQWRSRNNEIMLANVAVPVGIFELAEVNGTDDLPVAGSSEDAETAMEGWTDIVKLLGGSVQNTISMHPQAPSEVMTNDVQDAKAKISTYTFYQVDIILTPPISLPWTQFLLSYGGLIMILGAAVRLITPQIVVHATHLGSNWVAYPMYPPLRVPLCIELEDICHWFNLDLGRWRAGFDEMHDVYSWLVSAGGFLNAAWRKIQHRDPLVVKCGGEGQRRNGAWRAFCAWVEASGLEFEETIEEHEDYARGSNLKIGQTAVDPGRPNAIHGLLGRALDRWGKRGELGAMWTRQRELVRVEWDRKREKEWRRERSRLARAAGGWISLMGIKDHQAWNPERQHGRACTRITGKLDRELQKGAV